MPLRRPARFPASPYPIHNIQAANLKTERRTVKNNSAISFPDPGAAAKCDEAPQNLRARCVLCGDSSTKTAKRAKD